MKNNQENYEEIYDVYKINMHYSYIPLKVVKVFRDKLEYINPLFSEEITINGSTFVKVSNGAIENISRMSDNPKYKPNYKPLTREVIMASDLNNHINYNPKDDYEEKFTAYIDNNQIYIRMEIFNKYLNPGKNYQKYCIIDGLKHIEVAQDEVEYIHKVSHMPKYIPEYHDFKEAKQYNFLTDDPWQVKVIQEKYPVYVDENNNKFIPEDIITKYCKKYYDSYEMKKILIKGESYVLATDLDIERIKNESNNPNLIPEFKAYDF